MESIEKRLGRLSIELASLMNEKKEEWLTIISIQIDNLFSAYYKDANNVGPLIQDFKAQALSTFSRIFDKIITITLNLIAKNNSAVLKEIYRLQEQLSFIKTNLQLSDEGVLSLQKLNHALERKNQLLFDILTKNIEQFKILSIIEKKIITTIPELSKLAKLNKSKVSSLVRKLEKDKYVYINRKKRPQVISFITAPWR